MRLIMLKSLRELLLDFLVIIRQSLADNISNLKLQQWPALFLLLHLRKAFNLLHRQIDAKEQAYVSFSFELYDHQLKFLLQMEVSHNQMITTLLTI